MDLTILLVTRERPVLLEQSVLSILASADAAKRIVHTRVLVVDDSDTGSAEAVARALGVEYERSPVRVAGRGTPISRRPVGPDRGRAWAINRIETDLVALFDDDDLMLPDHIDRLARHILDGADICSTGYWLADPDPHDATRLIPRRRQLLRQPRLGDLLAGYQPVNDGAMMRTSVARSVEWDSRREILMMYHIWIQLLLGGHRFVVNRSATFLYRQHAASVSHNLGAREAALRAQLLAESRELAINRLGRVPQPSVPVRLLLARRRLGRMVAPL